MATVDDPRLFRASALARSPLPVGGLADWPPRGSVFEFAVERAGGGGTGSGSGAGIGAGAGAGVTLAVLAVAHAQRRGEVVAWLQPAGGALFPPDLAANGVDLDALVVVQPTIAMAAAARGERSESSDREPQPESEPNRDRRRPRRPHGGYELPRAAELLLRSGGFDLLVLDLRPVPPPRGPWLHRLQALVRLHQARLVLLSNRAQPCEPSSAIGQRLLPTRQRQSAATATVANTTAATTPFALTVHRLADKLHATLPPLPPCSGPAGVL